MNLDPQVGSTFFGRGELIALFEKRLDAFLKGYRQNIGVVGTPLLGKSLLAKTFCERTLKDEKLLPIFLSCRPQDSFDWFGERWIGEILLAVHRMSGSILPENLQPLIQAVKSKIPKTLKRMRLAKKMMLAHRYDQAYRELLELTAVVTEETGCKTVLFLDDFDRLEDMGLDDPFGVLGKQIMVQKEIMYVVTARLGKRSRAVFQEKLSLLFGNFEVLELKPFEFEETKAFIRARRPELPWTNTLLHFLIQLTNGHPHYLDRLLCRLPHTCPEDVLLPCLVDQITAELSHAEGVLGQGFRFKLASYHGEQSGYRYGDILLAIALGHKKISQIMRFLRRKAKDIKKPIEAMLRDELIEKHGTVFVLADPMLRFWLSKVYFTNRLFLDSYGAHIGTYITKEIRAAFDLVEREEQMELTRRIEQLLIHFGDEVVQLEERKMKCPKFQEIATRPANGRVFPILAKGAKARWMCQVLAGKVQEEDVHVFIDDLKRVRGSVDQKMIMGLGGIELNAKLLAKEAQIQYLDLRDLNLLMDVYDRPKIIV